MAAETLPPERPPVPNPALDLANLEARWAYATTQRERARLEWDMWNIARPSLAKEVRKHGCAKWLSSRLDESVGAFAQRFTIYQQGDAADAIWQRIDGPERMLVRAASQLLSRAKVRSVSEASSLRDAIDREFIDYDRGSLVETSLGTFRRREQRARGVLSGTRPTSQGTRRQKPTNVGTSRDLWTAVRASIKRVIDHELRGIADMREKELLRGQCELDVESCIRMTQTRIKHHRDRRDLNGAPINQLAVSAAGAHNALLAACELLAVDPPEKGDDVDFALYKLAKANYRKLVREEHPDHGGDVGRYDAVVKAMHLIEERYQNNGATKEP